ncbi:MAG: DUF559 domain-containing protein [Desulfobaccales bacterium]
MPQADRLCRFMKGGHCPPFFFSLSPLFGPGRGWGEEWLMTGPCAGALRKRMTITERLLWRHLRNREPGGWKFRRLRGHHVHL